MLGIRDHLFIFLYLKRAWTLIHSSAQTQEGKTGTPSLIKWDHLKYVFVREQKGSYKLWGSQMTNNIWTDQKRKINQNGGEKKKPNSSHHGYDQDVSTVIHFYGKEWLIKLIMHLPMFKCALSLSSLDFKCCCLLRFKLVRSWHGF